VGCGVLRVVDFTESKPGLPTASVRIILFYSLGGLRNASIPEAKMTPSERNICRTVDVTPEVEPIARAKP